MGGFFLFYVWDGDWIRPNCVSTGYIRSVGSLNSSLTFSLRIYLWNNKEIRPCYFSLAPFFLFPFLWWEASQWADLKLPTKSLARAGSEAFRDYRAIRACVYTCVLYQGGYHPLYKYLWQAGQGSWNSCWQSMEWLLNACICLRNSLSPVFAAWGFVSTGSCSSWCHTHTQGAYTHGRCYRQSQMWLQRCRLTQWGPFEVQGSLCFWSGLFLKGIGIHNTKEHHTYYIYNIKALVELAAPSSSVGPKHWPIWA